MRGRDICSALLQLLLHARCIRNQFVKPPGDGTALRKNLCAFEKLVGKFFHEAVRQPVIGFFHQDVQGDESPVHIGQIVQSYDYFRYIDEEQLEVCVFDGFGQVEHAFPVG